MRRVHFESTRDWQVFLGAAALSGASLALAFNQFTDTHRAIWVWPVTAMQLSLLLPLRSRARLCLAALLGGFAGTVGSALLLHMDASHSLFLGFNTACEVLLSAWILGPGVTGFEDLKKRHYLLRLAVVSVGAPLFGGLLTALVFAEVVQYHLGAFVAIAMLSDSLGIAILLPLFLFLFTGKYRNPRRLAPHLPPGIAPALLLLAAALGTFHQSTLPLLFATFPPLVLLVMTMGLEGAVFANVVIALVACFSTAHHAGPIWITHGATWDQRIPLLQIYLFFVAGTSLPIGALLDESRRTEMHAADARAIYLTLLEHAADMIVLSSFDGQERYISAACEQLTGWTPEEFKQLDRKKTCHPDDQEAMDRILKGMLDGRRTQVFRYRLLQKSGGWKWVEASSRAYYDKETGVVRGYVGTLRDISRVMETERERDQLTLRHQELQDLALTDTLTGLPNRRAFDLALTACREQESALLMIDIDCFKAYNDLYGHPAGDTALRAVADAIQRAAKRVGDLPARWGGEEFSLLLPGASSEAASHVAASILRSVQELSIRHAGGPESVVTVSIGCAIRQSPADDPERWIACADRALYNSKHAGRNRSTLAILESASRTGSVVAWPQSSSSHVAAQ